MPGPIKAFLLIAILITLQSVVLSDGVNLIEENERVELSMTTMGKANYLYSKKVPYHISEVVVLFEPKDRRKAIDEIIVYFSTNNTQPDEEHNDHKCMPKKYEPCIFDLPKNLDEKVTPSINVSIALMCIDVEACEFDMTILHTEEMFLGIFLLP